MLALLAAGCASQPVLAPQLPEGRQAAPVELTATPFFAQEQYQCGPAALATVLGASGVAVTPKALVERVYVPARKGSLQVEMLAASRRYGRLPYVIPRRLSALLAEVRGGHPVLVLQNLAFNVWPVWHYAVVIGYRPQSDELVLRSGVRRREVVSAARFLATWERAERWGMVLLRPGQLPAEPRRTAYLEAAAALEAVGQTDAARRAYQAALRLWPQSAIAWLGLGNTRYAEGDLDAAETAYREFLRRNPASPIGHNNLGQVLADQGCYRAALTEIETGLGELGAESELRDVLTETRAQILAHRSAGSEPPGCAALRSRAAGAGQPPARTMVSLTTLETVWISPPVLERYLRTWK
jgi:tetratricopeptide (TPR) repeat protein